MMRAIDWPKVRRAAGYGVALCLIVLLAGCQSPWIACTIVNHQTTPVSLVEVSYPGGSFGVQAIAPGASFRYRFHALGTDGTSIDFTDAAHKNHTVKGPELQLGQEGTLQIAIEADSHVTWTPQLRKAK
ncbi:MAG: hypothetical protein ACLGXA_04335 [Acidobacteriota bacterium]